MLMQKNGFESFMADALVSSARISAWVFALRFTLHSPNSSQAKASGLKLALKLATQLG